MSRLYDELSAFREENPARQLELGLDIPAAVAGADAAGQTKPKRPPRSEVALEIERLKRLLAQRDAELAGIREARVGNGGPAGAADAAETRVRCAALESELSEMRRRLDFEADRRNEALRGAELEIERLRGELRMRENREQQLDAESAHTDDRLKKALEALEAERRLRTEEAERFSAAEREILDARVSNQAAFDEQLKIHQARCSDQESRALDAERRRKQAEVSADKALEKFEKERRTLDEKLRLFDAQDIRLAPELRRTEEKLAQALDALDMERRLKEEESERADAAERLARTSKESADKQEHHGHIFFARRYAGLFALLLAAAAAASFLAGMRAERRAGAREAGDPAHLAPAPHPSFLDTTPRPPPPIWPVISQPGVLTHASASDLVMVFEYGIFTHSLEMTPKARADMLRLAEQLRPALEKGGMFLEIVGHTDPPQGAGQDVLADNVRLSLLRAETVRNLFIQEAGLPEEVVSASGAGHSDPPYSNHTAESRARNRTVTLTMKPSRPEGQE